MLSLKEINEVSFGKAGFSGYRPDDVDNFIDEVLDTFKQYIAEKEEADSRIAELTAKNVEFQEKLAILAKKIESYQNDEDGIKDAIVAAQKISKQTILDTKNKVSEMMDEAKEKVEAVMADARVKADKSIANAQKEADEILAAARSEASGLAMLYADKTEEKKQELDEMKKQVTAFRSSLLEMYKKHLELVTHIPTFKTKEKDAEKVRLETRAFEQETAALQNELLNTEENQEITKDETINIAVEQPGRPEAETIMPAPIPAPIPKSQSSQPRPQHWPESGENTQWNNAVNPEGNQVDTHPLNQRVDYTKSEEVNYAARDELAELGIDTKAFSIPEPLRKEKETRYSNLEFGDSIDVTPKNKQFYEK